MLLSLHRCIQKLKKKVRNNARVEAGIVEASLVEEATNNLCLYFRSKAPSIKNKIPRYDDGASTFQGSCDLEILNAVDASALGVFVSSQLRSTRLLSCTY